MSKWQGWFVVRIADTAASELSDKPGFDGAPACFICLNCVCSHALVTFRASASNGSGFAFRIRIVTQMAVANTEPASCKNLVKMNLKFIKTKQNKQTKQTVCAKRRKK